MFLIGMEKKKEGRATLFPKPDYVVLREELYFSGNGFLSISHGLGHAASTVPRTHKLCGSSK